MWIREIGPDDPDRAAWRAVLSGLSAESGAPGAAASGAGVSLAGGARGFVAAGPGGVIGAAWTGPDGPARFVKLSVGLPDRRHGIGSALLEAVRAAHPGTELKAVVVAGGPGERFAARLGATVRMRLTTMTQRLDELPPCPVVGGPEVVVWHGAAPARWREGYAAVRRHLSDAPGSEQQNLSEPARLLWVAAVIEDGAVAAITEVEVRAGADASQEATVVLPQWRGRGLAVLAKLTLAHHLHRVRPELESITTTINEANAPMAAVNRRAGYRPVRTRLLVALR
jgi:GNAT superfamily N-acetyltransferase